MSSASHLQEASDPLIIALRDTWLNLAFHSSEPSGQGRNCHVAPYGYDALSCRRVCLPHICYISVSVHSYAGPVTEEPTLYPPNPDLQKAPQLDSSAANTVLTYRLLTNHWRSSECFVGEFPTKVEVGHYSNASAIDGSDLDIQKDAIVSFCGSDFFPPELLQAKFVRTTRGPGRGGVADSKRQKLKEMEQKESESKGVEDKAAGGDATADGTCFLSMGVLVVPVSSFRKPAIAFSSSRREGWALVYSSATNQPRGVLMLHLLFVYPSFLACFSW